MDPEYAMPGAIAAYEAQWRDVTPDAPAGRTVRHVWVDGVLHTQTNTDPPADVPPHTGPELAAMRADSVEQRVAILEVAVSELGRRLDEYDRMLAHMAGLLHRHVNGTVGAESEM